MQPFFRFFRQDDDGHLDEEFRREYQAPGATYLGIGLAIALLTFLSFYLLDYMHGVLPAFGGVQSFRLAVVVVLVIAVPVCVFKRDVVERHYTLLGNLFIFGALQAAAYVAYNARHQLSYYELYWALALTFCDPGTLTET